MKSRIFKELKILLSASILGFFFAMMAVFYSQVYAVAVQNEIAENVIRFHVLANSDAAGDQALKNNVRDGILNRFGQELDTTLGIEETRAFLWAHLDEIEEYAAGLVQENGYDLPVRAVVDRAFFPTRDYGSMSFPAGEYEALRIIIGEGEGGNWWCVMFPPLCYMEEAAPLQGVVSDGTFALLHHSEGSAGVTVRFRVVEWWQERMNRDEAEMPVFVLN